MRARSIIYINCSKKKIVEICTFYKRKGQKRPSHCLWIYILAFFFYTFFRNLFSFCNTDLFHVCDITTYNKRAQIWPVRASVHKFKSVLPVFVVRELIELVYLRPTLYHFADWALFLTRKFPTSFFAEEIELRLLHFVIDVNYEQYGVR